MKRVAIQGIAGCFHETAARRYFRDEAIDVVPCRSFGERFARMAGDPALLGSYVRLKITGASTWALFGEPAD